MVGQLISAGVQTSQAFSQGRGTAVLDLSSPVDQFVTLIDTLSREVPLVLVLDDLHWADNATITLAMRLAMQSVGPLLLVLSYRVTPGLASTAADRAIRDARNNILRYKDDAQTIDLRELPDDALLEVLSQSILQEGRGIGRHELRHIVELSGGNPLVAECLLLTHGQADLATLNSPSDPGRIGAIMDISLSQLDPKESQFLEGCATVGPIFDADDVACALNLTVDEVLDQIDLLAMKGSLIDDVPGHRGTQRYEFHHPILVDVLRCRAKEQLNRWRRINDRLVAKADMLGDEEAWDAALLARMAGYAVEAERDAEAFRWALAASRKQMALGSTSTALGTARAAVVAAAGPKERLEARLVLVECLQAHADHDAVVEECDAALEDLALTMPVGMATTQASIRLHRLQGLRMSCEWETVLAELPQLIADLTAMQANRLRVHALMLLAETQLCGPHQDLLGCNETLEQLRDLELDAATLSRVVGHLGLVALALHDPVNATHLLDEAIQQGKTSSRPYDVYEAIHWMSKKQMACLELEEAAGSIAELQAISERHGIAGDTPFHDRDLSRVLGLLGRAEDGARFCVRYFDGSGSPDGVVASTLALQVAEIAELKGRDAANTFLCAFIQAAPGQMYDSSRRELASRLASVLSEVRNLQAAANDPVVIGVSDFDHNNALALFTFNVPNLQGLREEYA